MPVVINIPENKETINLTKEWTVVTSILSLENPASKIKTYYN